MYNNENLVKLLDNIKEFINILINDLDKEFFLDNIPINISSILKLSNIDQSNDEIYDYLNKINISIPYIIRISSNKSKLYSNIQKLLLLIIPDIIKVITAMETIDTHNSANNSTNNLNI